VSWQIEYDPEALKDLRKLDRSIQREILDDMDRRIGKADDPR
jgi:mRNA interferase RelE/StbE